MSNMLRKTAGLQVYECPVCAKTSRVRPGRKKAAKRDRHIARVMEKIRWKKDWL